MIGGQEILCHGSHPWRENGLTQNQATSVFSAIKAAQLCSYFTCNKSTVTLFSSFSLNVAFRPKTSMTIPGRSSVVCKKGGCQAECLRLSEPQNWETHPQLPWPQALWRCLASPHRARPGPQLQGRPCPVSRPLGQCQDPLPCPPPHQAPLSWWLHVGRQPGTWLGPLH